MTAKPRSPHLSGAFDITVLGGGPAGSALAILMARRGAKVALVEKSDFTAFRPGEHLPPQATGALDTLGCRAAEFAGTLIESPGILSDWGAAEPLFKSYVVRHQGPGLNLDRAAFDRALFAQAGRSGVACFHRASFISASRSDTRWHVSLRAPEGSSTISAALVADGTGRIAAFARRQGVAWQTHGDLAAVAAIVPRHSSMPVDDRLLVAACATGWWSATATPSGSVIATFYGCNSDRRRRKLSAAHWWMRGLESARIVAARLGDGNAVPQKHFVFPAFPRLMRPMHGPGWFAVGDAATCHDPLSGHGILYAFESAFRAAEMVSTGSSLGKIGRIYEEAMTERFARHITLRRDAYAEAAHRFPTTPFWSDLERAELNPSI